MSYISRLGKIYDEYIKVAWKDERSKPVIQQVTEMAYMMFVTAYWPQNYLKFGGYRKGTSVKKILDYIPGHLYETFCDEVLNNSSMKVLLSHKYLFNSVLRAGNVPATELKGYILENGSVYIPEQNTFSDMGDFIRSLDTDFVLKPAADTAQGFGVLVIGKKEGSWMIGSRKMNNAELCCFMSGLDAHEYLVEKKIDQHHLMSSMYSGSVNTVRILTLKKLNGDVTFLSAKMRSGKGGRCVDNWSGKSAGLNIAVDLDSGTIKGSGYDYYLNRFDTHPDTGFKFEGFQLPHWNKILAATERAAHLFPGVNTIGWDVAITEEGPVIIEGNTDYSIQGQQSCCGPLRRNKDFMKPLEEYIALSKNRARSFHYFFIAPGNHDDGRVLSQESQKPHRSPLNGDDTADFRTKRTFINRQDSKCTYEHAKGGTYYGVVHQPIGETLR